MEAAQEDKGEVSTLCMTIVTVSLIFFGVVGVYGNFQIMLATYLHKMLQSKCGLLLAILAFCDMCCLLFELLSAVRIISDTASMPRKTCFWSISVYLFVLNVECYMIFMVGLDRLLAICFPIKYMFLDPRYYIPACLAPGIVYSTVLFTLGAVNLDDVTIPVCNPPMAYVDSISRAWNIATMVSCGCTVLIYVATYIMLYKIAPRLNNAAITAQITLQKIMIKTLTVNVIAYAFSSILSAAIIFFMRLLKVSQTVINDAETYAVIPGLLSYSINYYVYFWRSSEYRRAFKQQLLCGYVITKVGRSVQVKRSDTHVFQSQVFALSRGPPRTSTIR